MRRPPQTTLSRKLRTGHGLNLGAREAIVLACRFTVITSHHVNVFVILFIAGMLAGSGAAFKLPKNDQNLLQVGGDKQR